MIPIGTYRIANPNLDAQFEEAAEQMAAALSPQGNQVQPRSSQLLNALSGMGGQGAVAANVAPLSVEPYIHSMVREFDWDRHNDLRYLDAYFAKWGYIPAPIPEI